MNTTTPASIEAIARRLTTKWVTEGIDSRNFSRLVRISRNYKIDLDAFANAVQAELKAGK